MSFSSWSGIYPWEIQNEKIKGKTTNQTSNKSTLKSINNNTSNHHLSNEEDCKLVTSLLYKNDSGQGSWFRDENTVIHTKLESILKLSKSNPQHVVDNNSSQDKKRTLIVREFNINKCGRNGRRQRMTIGDLLLLTMFIIFLISFLYFRLFHQCDCNFFILAMILSLMSLYKRVQKRVHAEKLLILPNVGLQIMEESIFGRILSAQLIPLTNIKAVIINETIKMQRVITYLAVVLHAPNCTGNLVIPVFKTTLPRLKTLERIYKDVITEIDSGPTLSSSSPSAP